MFEWTCDTCGYQAVTPDAKRRHEAQPCHRFDAAAKTLKVRIIADMEKQPPTAPTLAQVWAAFVAWSNDGVLVGPNEAASRVRFHDHLEKLYASVEPPPIKVRVIHNCAGGEWRSEEVGVCPLCGRVLELKFESPA